MRYIRTFALALPLLLLTGIFVFSPSACMNDGMTAMDSHEGDSEKYTVGDGHCWRAPVIPSFVRWLFPDGEWSADTICVANDRAYYLAYEERCRIKVIYSQDGILAKDPALAVLPFNKERSLFHVGIVGKDLLVDFSDEQSRRQLSTLTLSLPGFTPCQLDALADFCQRVSYAISLDVPGRAVIHGKAITGWLIGKTENVRELHYDMPPHSPYYAGFARKSYTGPHYEGDVHDCREICRFASQVYFSMVRDQYGLNETDYPQGLFSTLCLRAYMDNRRFVTYQQYTYSYYGDTHGYYTERLVSYDHVHRQEINYEYLFKDGKMEQVIALLKEEAWKSPNYRIWKPDIEQYTCLKDENGKSTGLYRLPQPGLSDKGVVFSFQPNEISCFAAGTFHLTIPYERLMPYLTDRAKWCIKRI